MTDYMSRGWFTSPRGTTTAGMLPKLEEALNLKQAGDAVSVDVEPEDGFGDYDPELVKLETADRLPPEIEVGMQFEAHTSADDERGSGDTVTWEQAAHGLALSDVPFYLAQPEAAGAIDPLVVTAHDLFWLFLFGAVNLGMGLAMFVTGARLVPAALAAPSGAAGFWRRKSAGPRRTDAASAPGNSGQSERSLFHSRRYGQNTGLCGRAGRQLLHPDGRSDGA